MSEGRTLVVGDIHGAARALEQALERAGFDASVDRLVSLGDLCDGWPDVDRAIDQLLGIERLDLVLGNHDGWTLSWMRSGRPPRGWPSQGGMATLRSYARRAGIDGPLDARTILEVARSVPDRHRELLERARSYLIEERPDGRRVLFTHAGWSPRSDPEDQDEYDLRWSRDLWIEARHRASAVGGDDERRLTRFDEVYLGHTPTEWREPRRVMELWNLDQGAGWDGRLTVMDVDRHEWWQSDPVRELYPGEEGRG